MAMSIATIDSPEFINVKPYNPLISQCEIKVLYVGENRNQSFISKEVAAEMAHSLPGCPIVGAFREDIQDFTDHGEKITIDYEGVKFESITKPYGFVSPNAQVWFQKFEDTDEFGNSVIREYLMTTGYLWTGQYEEAQRVIEKGNNQSMELDSETLEGHWATNDKSGVEFFIINDAIFSKLAILGENVEPCFEGASITAPEVSKSFTLMDDEFKNTLFTMMHDLKSAIESREGGLNMNEEELLTSEEEVEEGMENHSLEEDAPEEEIVEEDVQEDEEEVEEDEEEELPTEEEFSLSSEEYAEMQAELTTLREFKRKVEDVEKDNLIKSFYMLSDEDKADVIANKSQYSLDEIEAKLAVICVRNKVSFEKEDEHEDNSENNSPILTFNIEQDVESAPAFVQVLRSVKKD